ncbi:MAG: biotin carboxylase [Gammaproteobacteria bacterium]|nr:biotin carboxylase [Gammaproteobacteria bacterium]
MRAGGSPTRGARESTWTTSFDCTDLKPLIICRGPVRKEAMDVFEAMGITGYGILLSDRDATAHPNARAPETRTMRDRKAVHRVADYSGTDSAEREARIAEVIGIAGEHGYNAVFAGYGFMAEDEALVEALEAAGLNFIGPGSTTVRAAGRKDAAKRTALTQSISVTPGVDNVTSLALLARRGERAGLKRLAEENGLTPPEDESDEETAADALLTEAARRGIELVSDDEVLDAIRRQARALLSRFPDRRLRLKAAGGGGGKGQRVLRAPAQYDADSLDERLDAVAEDAVAAAREIWVEVAGPDRNVLIELNVDRNRHLEVQVLGNGDWCVALGLRDCSAQMHEQKLVEASVTAESLKREIRQTDDRETARGLEAELRVLTEMEDEAERFGRAVGLDSVSTFECIVDGEDHYFMEMNTRIQVEHRVTELCYALEFADPDDADSVLRVESLVEAMALVARHGMRLPKPRRVPRHGDALEVRLNATDPALRPSAGGLIELWSPTVAGEIRDDQGIGTPNPDTGLFAPYYLAGAYDSNIALLLTTGDTREETWQNMIEALRRMRIKGTNLQTNRDFHYGLLNWLAAQHPRAKIETRFVQAYLGAVGRLFDAAQGVDLDLAFDVVKAGARDRVIGTAANQSDEELEALGAGYDRAMDLKSTLILRPLQRLFANPHLLAGWVAASAGHFESDEAGGSSGAPRWRASPADALDALYAYLAMDGEEDPAAEAIWDHDRELLDAARAHYARLRAGLGATDFADLARLLREPHSPVGAPGAIAEAWDTVRAEHIGFNHGLQLLALPQLIARESGFGQVRVAPDLTVILPEELHSPDLLAEARRTLAPPPRAPDDEIVAEIGGMFHSREAPGMAPYLEPGTHFEAGDTLYIIEVMKMFTKVRATFAGTVDECAMTDRDGVVVRPGDLLFRVTPDERADSIDPDAVRSEVVENSRRLARMCADSFAGP